MIMISSSVLGDSYDSLSVIAESGLLIREKPNKESKVVTKIEFGTRIRRLYTRAKSDTIDKHIAKWELIEYNGVKGYVWGLYLSRHIFVKTSTINQEKRFMHEGVQCGQIPYSPGFYWYGIYKSENKDYQELREVQVKLIFQKLMEDQPFDSNGYKNTVNWLDGPEFTIETNQDEISYFLIGSKKKLEPGIITGKMLLNEYDCNNNEISIFLYPEKAEIFCLPECTCVSFISIDQPIIVDSSNFKLSSNFKIFVKSGVHGINRFDTENGRVINKELPFMGRTAKNHASTLNPQIIWYGDLDNDKKLDFIFRSNNMVQHGGSVNAYSLFLSVGASETEIIKAVASTISSGCDG